MLGSAVEGRQGKKLMIVGAGRDQVFMIDKAREMGLETIAIDMNSETVGYDHCDYFYPISTSDKESALEVAKQHKIDGVATSGTNDAICTVAYIKEQLNLPTICVPYDIAVRAVRKDLWRETFEKKGVPIALGFCSDDPVALYKHLQQMDFPVLVKPSDSSGARGITVVETPEQFDRAFRFAQKYANNQRIIVEEYLQGTVIGIESYTVDGVTYPIAIADKVLSDPPHCFALGVTLPTMLPKKVQSRIIDVNRKAIEALGINTGPTHIDMVVVNGEPKVIDVGPRLAGGPLIFELIPRTTGVDMIDTTIKQALGEEICIAIEPRGIYCASFQFSAPRCGVLRSIHYDEKDLDRYNITMLRFWKKVGEYVYDTQSGINRFGYIDRLGFVTAWAESYKEVRQKIDEFMGTLVFDIGQLGQDKNE
jgi:biotin carboxylase